MATGDLDCTVEVDGPTSHITTDSTADSSTVITPPTKLKIPPPVKPKTFRKASSPNQEKVLIRVTAVNDTDQPPAKPDLCDLEEKCQQFEKELMAVKQERDLLQKDNTCLKGELSEIQKQMKKAQNTLDRYNMLSKSRKIQGSLTRWTDSQPSISDLSLPMPHDELADPQELIKQFIESERLYLNCLETIDHHFHQPLKMFSIFKGEILGGHQFQALFLSSSQLLIIHKLFYQHLAHLRYLPKETRLEEFVIILERFVPSFSLYAGFQSENFMSNLQKELGQCQSKQQLRALLDNLNQKCEGKTLVDLLRMISGRLTEYHTLLTGLLADRLKGARGMKEGIVKRLETLKRYLFTLQLDLVHSKDWWDCIVEKLKMLNRVSSNSPIPMDIFHPATKLIKQGPVNIVVKGKELQRQLLLFTTHIVVTEKLSDQKIHFPDDGMKPLIGATVFSTIDSAGQVIEPDFHSGLKEDMLGFRINLSQDFLVIRVGKPNEKKAWLEGLENAIQMIKNTEESDLCEAVIPEEAPKIAAASLEKLFNQLTNPQIAYKEEFIDVFLKTFQCFTTPKNVLTALLNCIRSQDKGGKPPQILQSSNDVFTFNMEDGVDTESSISASNSILNISDYDSDGSLSDSPILSRRGTCISSTPLRKTSTSKVTSATAVGAGPRMSVMTTDSDSSSPYTSGVPVADNDDRMPIVEMGWSDMGMIIHQNGRINSGTDKGLLSKEGMSMMNNPVDYPPSSNYSQDSYENDMVSSSSQLQVVPETNLNTLKVSRSVNDMMNEPDSFFEHINASLHEQPRHVSIDYIENFPPHSDISTEDRVLKQSKITADMDEATRVCEETLNSFQTMARKQNGDDDDSCCSPETDEINHYRNYMSRTRHSTDSRGTNMAVNRMSIASNNFSISEPDLLLLSVKQHSRPSENLLQVDYEEDELMMSLPASTFRKIVESSTTPSHKNSKAEKSKSGKFRLKGKKSKEKEQKSELAGGGSGDRRHTLNPSSSLYFNSSVDSEKVTRSSPSRGFHNIFKKKDKDSKKVRKSPSMAASDYSDGGYPETPKRRTGRSSSLAPSLERHVYMNIDDFGDSKQLSVRGRYENGSPVSRRKASTQVVSNRNFALVSKVFTILAKWIEAHFEDFQDDPSLMQMLDEFLQSMIALESAESKFAEQLLICVNHFKLRSSHEKTGLEALKASMDKKFDLSSSGDWCKSSKVLGNRTIDLGKSSGLKETGFVKSFAEQLTLIKYSCYSAIKRRELLNCNWKKKEKESLSPNVCQLIKQTNEMTSWICTEILLQDSPATRATALEHFIAMAMVCYKHHDMHCALSIAVALSSAPIKRLTKTWDAVERKAKQKFEKLKDFSDPQEKCKKLRDKIERITTNELEKTDRVPSCLPYLGAYLDIIYSLDIGAKTYNTDGLVNFTKMTKLSAMIDTFLQYQQSPYNFELKHDITEYIFSAKRLSENELYELSVKKEPSKK